MICKSFACELQVISMWIASHLHTFCKSFNWGTSTSTLSQTATKTFGTFSPTAAPFCRTVENAFHICNFLKSCPSSFDTCETARTCGGPTRSTLFSTKMGAESVLMELRCFSHRFRASWTSSKCSRYAFVRLLVTAPNFRFLAAPPFNGDRRLCSWAHHKK